VAQLKTQHLRMESWTAELADAALNDRRRIEELLGVCVPDDFPNPPVRDFVLLDKITELQADPGRGMWSGIIIHVADNIVIGSMGFKAPPDDGGMVEIGYDIIPAYQGQGYATEMATFLMTWAFEQSSVKLITAKCLPDNLASIRVLQKLGMQQVESSTDMLVWELLRIGTSE